MKPLTVKELKVILLCFIGLYIWTAPLSAQKDYPRVSDPELNDFYRIMLYLSSDSTQGREAGTRGARLASDYIASVMQSIGLEPFGDQPSYQTLRGKPGIRSWFQDFEAVAFRKDRDSMIILQNCVSRQPADGHAYEADEEFFPKVSNPDSDTLSIRNVLGLIRGYDTTRCIIIGAHYDHLGVRDGKVYYGADDNASGVSGMLALAGKWASSGVKPSCNIIFAAWAAEEKGLIGSRYFLQNGGVSAGRILLAFNMDMIAGNEAEDKNHRQLSIGTLPSGKNLRHIARKANRHLAKPFNLDLWDVSGRFGSDYAYFTLEGIPVMTFFSGYSMVYHTPGDTFEKADLQKMSNILKLVNECIRQVLQTFFHAIPAQ